MELENCVTDGESKRSGDRSGEVVDSYLTLELENCFTDGEPKSDNCEGDWV